MRRPKAVATTESASADAQQIEGLNELSTTYVAARRLHVAADLAIADLIGEPAETAEDLARKVGASAAGVAGILRMLSRQGALEGRQTPTDALMSVIEATPAD